MNVKVVLDGHSTNASVQNSVLCVLVVGSWKVNVCVLCKTVYCVCQLWVDGR